MSDEEDRALMEYLRVFVMVWQKIDFIWGMFITTYIPIFGLLQFYPRDISAVFALLLCLAVGGFTWINGASLRMHYRLSRVMLREFRSLNRRYPMLGAEMGVVALERKPAMVLMTHGVSFAAFLYLMGERVGTKFCTPGDGPGWLCLLRTAFE